MNEPFLTEYDIHLLKEGTHYRSFEKLGAHPTVQKDQPGTYFALWAPNAKEISIIGDWNEWKRGRNPMSQFQNSGFWECFIPKVGKGALYKYAIRSSYNNFQTDKADPYGFFAELVPQTASRVWELSGYNWRDDSWMKTRAQTNSLSSPITTYEVHLGSWMRVREEGNRFLTYREIAPKLAAYIKEMGYTHVEFLPLSEHPFYGSWGYQTVGYYAPTSRYGTPQDLMYLIDTLHQQNIGVLLDWVPAHFPRDGHGLVFFDGTHLYEHADPRQGIHLDWGTFIFNYGRPEVQNFLLSNALFWLEKYHIDGLRVDAVASMLYLDYSRKAGEWVPNPHGGRENLEAIDFIRKFNELVYQEHPDVLTIAEESTAWPMVSRPTYLGGLGFGLKWNMGWMHDILDYMEQDPIHRSYHHNKLTFGMMYAFSENFVLAFSHDEVVHLKKSMLGKMPGDDWQKFANLRLLYGFMTGHPGKKLLFMGGEFGQWREWNHDRDLEWELLQIPEHRGLQKWVKDLNHLYSSVPALHEINFHPEGFEWIDCNDHLRSVVSFLRWGKDKNQSIAFACNFTPIPRSDYRIGVPWEGTWEESLNSDAAEYGGSGMGNYGKIKADKIPSHGRPFSLNLTLPPLSVVILRSHKPVNSELSAHSPDHTADQETNGPA
jgi:1,4-alpha-glucan branching enzyme